MNQNEQINKIKIALFGNIWVVRLVKLLRYLSVVLVGFLTSKSKYLFPASFQHNFQTISKWKNQNADTLLRAIFALSFFGLLLFIFFCLSGWLVDWLVKINITPQQQTQILQKKTYTLDEKTSYSVNKFDNLEITTFRTYSSLQGILFLSNGKQKKTVNFVCNFAPSNLENYLETYFPKNNVKFKTKTFFTWQKFVLLILFLGTIGYFFKLRDDVKELPDYSIDQVVMSKAVIQKEAAKKLKEQQEADEKKERHRRAGITDPKEINVSFKDIGYALTGGTLKEILDDCKTNARAIKARNQNPGKKGMVKPQHILLFGPPGTGKTMIAKAMAKESDSIFLNTKGADFRLSPGEELGFKESKRKGPGEELKTKIAIARQEIGEKKSILVFIDEIDQAGEYKDVAQEFQTVLDDPKHENVVVVATTNWLERLSMALLRTGRVSKKLLVSYPEKPELFGIIEKVLEKYHDELFAEIPELFGNLDKFSFKRKFARKICDIMTDEKYEIKYGDMGVSPGSKLDPNDGRILFTGADVWKVVFEEATIFTERRGSRTLKEEDFAKAIERVYRLNRIDRRWMIFAHNYLQAEIMASRNQKDDRTPEPHRGPHGPS